MNEEYFNLLMERMEQIQSSTDGTIAAACITIGGMIFVSFVSAVTQWKLTKQLIESEFQKQKIQLSTDYKLRRFEKWRAEYLEAISELLTRLDPDFHQRADHFETVSCIHRAQLLLNPRLAGHDVVNDLITELGLAATNWRQLDKREWLNLHSELIKQSRLITQSDTT